MSEAADMGRSGDRREPPDEDIFGGRDSPITHLVIFRACGPDPDGACAQVRLDHRGEPDRAFLDKYMAATADAYEAAFGEAPVRTGCAVLPWVAEHDAEDGGGLTDEEYDEADGHA